MTDSGLNVFEEGTKTKKRVPSSKNFSVPSYLKTALAKNKKAWNNFQSFCSVRATGLCLLGDVCQNRRNP